MVEVVTVDIAVEPLGHIGGGEDTESLFLVAGREQSSAVLNDLIVLRGKLIIVVLVLIRDTSKFRRVELLGATTENDIERNVCPSVVLDTIEVGIDDSSILATETGV